MSNVTNLSVKVTFYNYSFRLELDSEIVLCFTLVEYSTEQNFLLLVMPLLKLLILKKMPLLVVKL